VQGVAPDLRENDHERIAHRDFVRFRDSGAGTSSRRAAAVGIYEFLRAPGDLKRSAAASWVIHGEKLARTLTAASYSTC
jgi:hypothetical protein